MNTDSWLFCLLHPNSPSSIDKNPTNTRPRDKGKVDKRDKKRKEIGSGENGSKMKRGKGKRWRRNLRIRKRGRIQRRTQRKGRTAKAVTVFCQGNKDQVTAVATYQHSERECKSALMQMLYVFRGKTGCLYTNPPTQHTSLCAIWTPQLSSNAVRRHARTNTSRRQSCAKREKRNHKRQHHLLTSR